MPAQTIDEVIAQLDETILRARQESCRLGFFAALYRNVTLKVREGISAGHFEDAKLTPLPPGSSSSKRM